MDEKERLARQKWLREMAAIFEDIEQKLSSKAREQGRIEEKLDVWLGTAVSFYKQHSMRAKVYSMELIAKSKNDAELKERAGIANQVLKAIRAEYKLSAPSVAIEMMEALSMELEHILKKIAEREEWEND